MKKSWGIICLTLVILSAGGMAPSSPLRFYFSDSKSDISFSKFNIGVPQTSLDLSDLDARDKNNRPIRNAQVVRQMEYLFVSSLSRLLLFNLTPIKLALRELLSKSWDVTSGLLKACQRIVQVMEIILSQSYKFGASCSVLRNSPIFIFKQVHQARGFQFINTLQLITSVQLLR